MYKITFLPDAEGSFKKLDISLYKKESLKKLTGLPRMQIKQSIIL
ncbi:MAG: hypothetical protein AB1348_09590 [Nitrospirota bacterium]